MKKILTFAFAACAASLAVADAVEARNAFEQSSVEAFARSVALPFELAPASARYDQAPDKATYVFALPYARDSRLRFVTGEFAAGKFVSARLAVFGFEPKPIDAAAFEALRDAFPMVSIRQGTDDVNPTAVLYPARERKLTRRVTNDLYLGENPVGYVLGALGSSIGRVGTSLAKVAYRVTLKGAGGETVELGIATAKDQIKPLQVMNEIRAALEAKTPARKGTISDRDVINFRHGGEITFTAVELPKRAAKQ